MLQFAEGLTDQQATHVLAATRDLNRLEFVVETLRAALNEVAEAAGDWLAAPEWFDRCSARPEDSRNDPIRSRLVAPGAASPAEPAAVEFLRRTWVQQFQHSDGVVRWREPKDLPPGLIRLRTRYEPEARTGAKRDLGWSGYKVHLSETCEPNAPHLITLAHRQTPRPHPHLTLRSPPPRWMSSSGADSPSASGRPEGPLLCCCSALPHHLAGL